MMATGESDELQFHPGIICDGCDGPIFGRRFKCEVCDDYDLCVLCKSTGLHGYHTFLVKHAPQAAGEEVTQKSCSSESPKENEIRIILLGRTGSGKSATSNTIIGERKFTSVMSPSSVTQVCQREERILEDGRKLVVVDTPGFFDTSMPSEHVTREISKCVSMTTPGPHVVIYVQPCGRYTPQEAESIDLFFKQFGDDVKNYMMVLFTRVDEIDGIAMEQYISEAPKGLHDLLHFCDCRYLAFNNKVEPEKSWYQVCRLIGLIDEIMEINGHTYYTDEMYDENDKMVKEKETQLRQMLMIEEERKLKEIEFNVEMECGRLLNDLQATEISNKLRVQEMRNQIQILQHEKDLQRRREIQELNSQIVAINNSSAQQRMEYQQSLENIRAKSRRMIEAAKEESQRQYQNRLTELQNSTRRRRKKKRCVVM